MLRAQRVLPVLLEPKAVPVLQVPPDLAECQVLPVLQELEALQAPPERPDLLGLQGRKVQPVP